MTRPAPGGALRERMNDLARVLIAVALFAAGIAAIGRHRIRLVLHRRTEARLRRRYRITAETPWTRELPAPAASGPDPVALTSGTSGDPKRVAYSRRRLREVRGVFIEAMLRLIVARRVRRPSLYIFGALDPDRSLSRLLIEERGAPPRFVVLQAPYRAQFDPALLELAREHGAAALRLLVITVSNPGMLYATNPSTLSAFFEELEADWERGVALARRVARRPETLAAPALRAIRRLTSVGAGARLTQLAESDRPLPITAWAPAAATCICWTGGALAPFLKRLDDRLPAPRFRREPMFSLSTETIETIPDYRREETAFLPAAPGVLSEFLAEDGTGELRAARELRPGETVELVVSHAFGLRRYATGDLFFVERLVAGLPDLGWRARGGRAWAFTGETRPAALASRALCARAAAHPGRGDDFWLALFPSDPGPPELPGYLLAVVCRPGDASARRALPDGVARRLDELLAEQNLEYRAKRESRRLGPVRLAAPDLPEFVRRATGGAARLDSQFKFLPLYPRRWEGR